MNVALRLLLAGVLLLSWSPAAAQTSPGDRQLARDIFRELVEINTVTATGDTARAAGAMAARLRAAGFADADVNVFTPAPRKGNLVARLRGTGARRPLLLMAHLDVVEALRADWSVDPFAFIERDGYYYGRGTSDDKGLVAAWVTNLIRLRQEGFVPDRDIVLVLATDEETADRDALGIQWLLANHRDLLDAELALNEGGGVSERDGQLLSNNVQTSEKRYATFRLEARNRGGHSSVPSRDNAIYQLAAGLTRVASHEFPIALNATTRAWLERSAAFEAPATAADMRSLASARPDPAAAARLSAIPAYNAQLRTTCVATMLEGGHAENALPQLAAATVNCRILPGGSPESVQATLVEVVNDPAITITAVETDVDSPPSPMHADLFAAIEVLTAEFWPGIPIIPTMSTGATDSRFLRNAGIPSYGHTGIRSDVGNVRAHGQDERVGVEAFHTGVEYLYRLVRRLSSGVTGG